EAEIPSPGAILAHPKEIGTVEAEPHLVKHARTEDVRVACSDHVGTQGLIEPKARNGGPVLFRAGQGIEPVIALVAIATHQVIGSPEPVINSDRGGVVIIRGLRRREEVAGGARAVGSGPKWKQLGGDRVYCHLDGLRLNRAVCSHHWLDKDSTALVQRRHVCELGFMSTQPKAFVAAKEESPIFLDRSAESAAELVGDESWLWLTRDV